MLATESWIVLAVNYRFQRYNKYCSSKHATITFSNYWRKYWILLAEEKAKSFLARGHLQFFSILIIVHLLTVCNRINTVMLCDKVIGTNCCALPMRARREKSLFTPNF